MPRSAGAPPVVSVRAVGGDRRGVARDAARSVLVCISNPGLAAELSLALGEVGFRVEVVDTVDGLSGRDGDAATSVVIIDDSVASWLRVTIDLVRRRPDVRPVVLADIDSADEFLAALTGGVAGFCRSDASVDATTASRPAAGSLRIAARFKANIVAASDVATGCSTTRSSTTPSSSTVARATSGPASIVAPRAATARPVAAR